MKFGTDGVRGIANTDLTPSFALDLGRAAARVLAGRTDGVEAVVGGDTRVSTAMLEAAFVAGMASEGIVVHRLGVVPTPAVAFEAHRRDAIGAVISASHNPYLDNGIKLFARGGIEAARRGRGTHRARGRDAATAERRAGPVARRRGDPRLPRPSARRPRRPRSSGLRIVVDCANGAASAVAPRLFAAAGADVVAIHNTPNGRNINDRCGATHLDSLAGTVVVENGRPRPRPRR